MTAIPLLPAAYYDFFARQRITPSPIRPTDRPTLLSQVRTNGSVRQIIRRSSTRKRGSRRKPINPIGRISEGLYARGMKSRDMRVRTDGGRALSEGTARPRREEREYRENTRRQRKEVGGVRRDAWYAVGAGRG